MRNISTWLLLVIIVATLPPQSLAQDVGCSVCGEGKEVGHPNSVFGFPGQPSVSCDTLENAGAAGLIPFDLCPLLPNIVDDLCNCVPIGTPVAPVTPSPSRAPTVGCRVCGDEMEVGRPNGVFAFPGQPPFPCDVLENAGATGEIPLDQCFFLPPLVQDPCNCVPIGTPVAPVTPIPTRAPDDVGCSVCGDGKEVGHPNSVFVFPGQPIIPCDALENAGATGSIPFDTCTFLPPLIGVCNCVPIGTPVAPATPNPTPKPPTPFPTRPACSVCGDGLEVGHPNRVVEFGAEDPQLPSFPFGQSLTCEEVELRGKFGFLSPDECSLVPPLVSEPCNCVPIGTPVAPVTPAPTLPPPRSPPCSVCGEGLVVSNANAVFSFPGQPDTPCGVLEEAGAKGELPPGCQFLPPFLGVCGCSPGALPLFESDGEGGSGGLPTDFFAVTLAPVTISTIDQIISPSIDEDSTTGTSSSSRKQMASKKGKNKGMGMMKAPKI